MPRQYEGPPASAAERDARAVRARHSDPRHSVQEIARRLGHTEVGVVATASGRRWFAYCSCGWASSTGSTESVSAQSAVHHVTTAVKAWHRTGTALPPEPGVRPVPWTQMARKYRHVEQWLAARPTETRSADRMVS